MLPFELLHLFAKNELRNIAYASFKNYNKKDHKCENISAQEHKAFLELMELENIIIQKADKGNVVVLIDKNTYVTKLNNILSDKTKFVQVEFDKRNKELDYLLNKQNEIKKFLEELKSTGVISGVVFKNLNPCGSQPGVLYGLCKVHKASDGQSPPFRPILSAINTPSYKIAKFLVPLLSEFTKYKFVSKDSFE